MRHDVYIENDSGGFSVLAAQAADAIIEDARENDEKFVEARQAMLLMLYGDDSMLVRVVADEPLTTEENAQWLARATGRIRTTDGHMLVMGGFDPDVLSWWRDGSDGGDADGRGVASIRIAPGDWQVDIYAHVGSMNGRAILSEAAKTPTGAAFRRAHGQRPFPLWLAQMLDFSGEEDPGHEELWTDVPASVREGHLALDLDAGDAIGMLVHFTRAQGEPPKLPEGAWFDHDAGQRIPKVFPLGLPSDVADPGLTDYRDRILGRERPEAPRPIADGYVPLIAAWSADAPRALEGGGSAGIAVQDAYLLYWIAALTTDAAPRFEWNLGGTAGWAPPASTPDFGVMPVGPGSTGIGPVSNSGGWHTWWAARTVTQALGALPDGTAFDLAIVPQSEDAAVEQDGDDAIGLARYTGTVRAGVMQVERVFPPMAARDLDKALAFVRDMVAGRVRVRGQAERAACV